MNNISNEFVQYGVVTPAGQEVIEHINSTLAAAEATNDVDAINSLAGHIKHYYVNVTKLRAITPAQFLESYPNAARSIAGYLRDVRESAAAKQAEIEERTRLSESLDEVKAALDVALQKIAKMEAERMAAASADDAAVESVTPEPVKSKKG